MALSATLTLNSDVSQSAGMTKTGATTWYSQVNETSLDTANYINSGSTPTTGYSAEFGMTDMPTALGIDSVVFTISAGVDVSDVEDNQRTRAFIRHNGTISNETWVTATKTTTPRTWTMILNPVTGSPWTQAAVNALQCGIELEYGTAAGSFSTCWMLYATAKYTPRPATVDVTRYVGSYDLHLKRRAESFVTFTGGLDSLAVPLLGLVDLEHIAGPHPSDEGWKAETWQRRPFAVHGHSIDLNTLRVTTRLKDQHPIRCLVRDLAWSDKASGPLGDGIARFAVPGATWSFTRASSATFTNPVGESETVATDVPAYADGGLQILAAAGGRAQDVYRVTNSSTARTWNAERGSFECEVALATVSGGFQVVCGVYHDANNNAAVAWDGANSRWIFNVRAGGTLATAYKAASPSSGVFYQIGARWLSSSGEYGGTARAISVWVDRVKGTDAAAAATMTEVSTPTYGLEIGAYTGSLPLDGQIRKVASYAYPKSDVEMSRTL